MSELQKIRIKLKAYDHALLDQSAAKIVETAKEDGRRSFRPYSASYGERSHHYPESSTQVQRLKRAVRAENSQETHRHHKRHS